MKNKNGFDKSEKTITIKPAFLVLLLATVALIVALTIGLVVVMCLDDSGREEPRQTQEDDEGKNPSKPVGSNSKALFPTVESRSSYKISISGSVVKLTDEIGGNNTVLVKVGADSLTSIVEKNADAKMYPASMTKVMTLLVACERVTDLEEKLTVTQEIADFAAANDGSGAGLKVGESYTVEDLLYLIAYQSDTIASILIAEHIVGSEAAFVELMNAKVAELGLTGTRFDNCTGLYSENNYSTCKDIASIMAYALDNEMAYKCLTSYSGRPMVVGGTDCTFYSGWYSGRGNRLGFADNPRLSSTTVIAGKTGYVDEAGFTFVTVAKDKSGGLYINVTVGQPKGQMYTAEKFMKDVKMIYNTYAK
ncbi:MAG: D-alanyl-D-alanine carboxypeptidase [Ruminococcaceae bacterium]|nr:D-alanyl-D-alanine carboxypeptidase [Oscillospiraceae bacterium]